MHLTEIIKELLPTSNSSINKKKIIKIVLNTYPAKTNALSKVMTPLGNRKRNRKVYA